MAFGNKLTIFDKCCEPPCIESVPNKFVLKRFPNVRIKYPLCKLLYVNVLKLQNTKIKEEKKFD